VKLKYLAHTRGNRVYALQSLSWKTQPSRPVAVHNSANVIQSVYVCAYPTGMAYVRLPDAQREYIVHSYLLEFEDMGFAEVVIAA